MNLVGRRIDYSRIQRTMRQIGRIRAGDSTPTVSKGGKTYNQPRRSKTFILSSDQRPLIARAAQLWGGEVEPWTPQGSSVAQWRVTTDAVEIPVILPPGDPFSSMYEMWERGKCLRRCDGVTEELVNRTPKPCLCIAQFGDYWHERPPTNPPQVCKPTGRLNVYLELGDEESGFGGDFGYWRADVHSFHAIGEMAGIIDYIKGVVGHGPSIRAALAIEQRAPKGTPYPVVAIRIRDGVMLQILSGVTPSLMLDGGPPRPAIEAGRAALTARAHVGDEAGTQDAELVDNSLDEPAPAPEPAPAVRQRLTPAQWRARLDTASDLDELRGMWRPAMQDGALDPNTDEGRATREAFTAVQARLQPTAPPAAGEPAPAPEPAPEGGARDDEPDRLVVWGKINAVAAERGWDMATVAAEMKAQTGYEPKDADGWAMQIFLNHLTGKDDTL